MLLENQSEKQCSLYPAGQTSQIVLFMIGKKHFQPSRRYIVYIYRACMYVSVIHISGVLRVMKSQDLLSLVSKEIEYENFRKIFDEFSGKSGILISRQ